MRPRSFNPFALGFTLTLGGLAALVLGLAISNLSAVLVYITIALFAALGLDPVVQRLERRGIGRGWDIVIVYAAFAVIVVGIGWLIVPATITQITNFIGDFPRTVDHFRGTQLYGWLSATFGDEVSGVVDQLRSFISDPARLAAIGGGIVHIGVTVGTAISGFIIVLVLSLYFLATLPTMKAAFTRLMPAYSRPTVSSIVEQIAQSIGSYLGGMVVLAFFNALVAFFLYLFLGLPFPILMAVIAFAITLIPLIGSVLFWILGSAIALLNSPISALIFAIIYLVYMQIEAYVLTPRVMNRAVEVPGALVVIGALVGGTLLGLLGALVAIPVTASILLIIKQVVIPRQDAKVQHE